jgi:hypothetical protein
LKIVQGGDVAGREQNAQGRLWPPFILPIALLSVSIITAVYRKAEKYIDKEFLAIIITIKLVDIFDYHITMRLLP